MQAGTAVRSRCLYPFFAAPALPFAFDAAAVMLCPAMFLVDGTAHKPRVAPEPDRVVPIHRQAHKTHARPIRLKLSFPII